MSTKELSGRELNLEIAQRLMGYRWFHCVSGTGVERNQFCSPDQEETWRGVGWKLTALSGPPPPDQFNDDSGCPLFGSSIEAAMRVEDRIAELGLQSAYYRALLDIVANSITDRLFHHFDLIHASAEQRCRAALAAMEQKS